jgi:N-acetylneuraminate lyase
MSTISDTNTMEGLFVASIVPFTDDGNINEPAIRQLIERNLNQGAAGFFIAGSSGQCFLLSESERIRLFEIFAEYRDRCTLFAHVGANSTSEAIRYAKAAQMLGISRVAATPPLYFGYSTQEIAEYYDDISSSIGHGVYYYNIPMNTHRKLNLQDPDTRSMFASGSIAGVKQTNLDVYEMDRIRSINPQLRFFGGLENEMLAFLAMGCNGFIGSIFNFMLPHYTKILDSFQCGNSHMAQELQIRANNIMEVLMKEGLFQSITYIVNSRGTNVGSMRKPFKRLGDDARKNIDVVLEKNLMD